MRVISRSDFLETKDGTIFAKLDRQGFPEAFCQKVETVDAGDGPIDWWYRAFDRPVVDDDESAALALADPERRGEEFELDETLMRDGMFDDDDLFLVYDWEDIRSINSALWWGMHSCLE